MPAELFLAAKPTDRTPPPRITSACPAWHPMWRAIMQHDLNDGDVLCLHDDTGEVWQYMGCKYLTVGDEDADDADAFAVFRHRRHPKTDGRV